MKHDLIKKAAGRFSNIRIVLFICIGFLSSCSNPKSELEKMKIPFSEEGFVQSAEKGDQKAVELFIKAKMNVLSKDKQGWTPLSVAVANGHTGIVKLLLENGADPKQEQSTSENTTMTMLQIAAQKGKVPILEELLAKGISVDTKDHRGGTPLFEAADAGQAAAVQFLLDHGANPNAQDNKGGTALMFAAEKGSLEIVKILLSKNADVLLKNQEGSTALMNAAYQGHTDVLKAILEKSSPSDEATLALFAAIFKGKKEAASLLIGKSKDINFKSPTANHWTPLMLASERGDPETVRQLLDQGADPKIKADQNATALHLAVLKNHPEVLIPLIEKGADLNARESQNGNTPLLIAISKGFTPIVKTLLEKGADVNSADKIGFSGLMIASQNGKSDIVDLLIQHHVNVNTQAKGGVRGGLTALMCAATRGYGSIVQTLLKNGADPTIKDEKGALAWMYAQHNGHSDLVPLLKSEFTPSFEEKNQSPSGEGIEITEEIVPSGESKLSLTALADRGDLALAGQTANSSNINLADANGWTPLMYAASKGNEAMIRLLISKGANINAHDPSGWTPLMLASFQGNAAVLKQLLNGGAEINAITPKKTTALIIAAGSGHLEAVQLLLQFKADFNLKDSEGKTALVYAAQKNHASIVEILKNAGSKE